MSVLFTNNAATTLSAGINSSVTAIDVADGSVFPALSGSNYFYVTFENVANTQREIVKVTARSGNTLTVTRGQDGTTGAAFISSDKVELRLNAAALNEATAGQTAAEIRSLIESATDSNVFTDADHTKLDNVETYVGNQITALVDSSPATLDTLNELAAALGDDPSFATTVSTSIGTKWTQNNTKISNWDTAYGWGDHSTEGYVTTDTTYTAGSGLSLTGTEFANTAPDQTVSLTGSGATSISGTYPSFTISSTDTNTTYSVGDGGLTQKNFTTALKTKLDGIATGATNVTNNNQLTNGAGYVTTDTNTTYSVGDGGLTQKNFTTTLKTKLDGIETGATADQTPSQILTAVLGVDGSGSGLDADLLDGVQGSGYVNTTGNQNIDGIKVFTGVNVTLDNPVNSWKYIRLQSSGSAKWDIATNENDTSGALQFRVGGGSANTAYVTTAGNYVSDTQGTLWGSSNDGSGSGLDADLLDGQHGSYYSSASNLNAGTVPLDRMNKVLPSSGNYVWNNSTTAGSYTLGLQCSFVSSSQGFPSYGAVLHVGARGGADAGGDYQIYCGHGSNYGGNHLRFRNADNDASPSDSWTGWKTLWDSGNDGSGSGLDADLLDGQHGSYYYPKSGGTITGATQITFSGNNYFEINSSTSGEAMTRYNNTVSNLWYTGIRSSAQLVGTTGYHIYSAAHGQTSLGVTAAGNVIAAADMRAPIFYDSANTGYYVDPSANSYLLGATYGGLSIGEAPTNYDGWNKQLNVNGSSHARIHAKTTSGRRMGIYAHDTWHNGGGGYVGTYSNHQMTFVQNAGSAGYIDTAKNLQWQHSVRAPIFYDSDNTGYYSDPNSTSRLNTINADDIYNYGWFRNQENNEGMYNQNNGAHWYSSAANQWNMGGGSTSQYLRMRTQHNSTIIGTMYTNTSYQHGFLNTSDGWKFFADNSNNFYCYGNITAYYSDTRLKDNQTQLTSGSGLALINQLKVKSFVWNNLTEDNPSIETGSTEIGLIAQEVETLIPNAVVINEASNPSSAQIEQAEEEGLPVPETPDYKTINYDKLIPFLIQSVQDLSTEVNNLKAQLESK